MTLAQSHELAMLAKEKGYVLAAHDGKVQFQVLDKKGNVEIEVTDWLAYDEAKAILCES